MTLFAEQNEPRAERLLKLKTKVASKFAAAKDFDNGVKRALFMEPLDVNWDAQTAIWNAGYKCGVALKKQLFDARNACLSEHGIDPIREMRLQ